MFSVSFGHKSGGSIEDIVFTADFYLISFQSFISGSINYGKKEFDHGRGKMIFSRPNQTVTFKNVKAEERFFLIAVKEDFLSGTALYEKLWLF